MGPAPTLRRMPYLYQHVHVSANKSATVRMLVDTGATYSVIPKSLARRLGITRLRPVRVSLANGQRVKVDAGLAVFALGGREAPSTILVADVVEPILGVGTLDALGLQVDLRRRRVKRSRPYAVRL
jgi:aspartyl protease family protein